MKGARQIVELRKQRSKPSSAFLTVGHCPAGWEVETEIRGGTPPQVWTGADDPQFADLRWAMGLRVVLDHDRCSAETFWRWFDAVKAAKPALLVALEPDGETVIWRG